MKLTEVTQMLTIYCSCGHEQKMIYKEAKHNLSIAHFFISMVSLV